MNGEEKHSALLGIPPPHVELLISRLKRKGLGNNNGLNKQLPRGIKIPTSMSNNAAISLYSSIVHAEKENDGRNGATNIEGDNNRSIKYYASEKYNKLKNKLLSDELKKDKESGKYLINTSLLAMQEHVYELKKKSHAIRNYQPSINYDDDNKNT